MMKLNHNFEQKTVLRILNQKTKLLVRLTSLVPLTLSSSAVIADNSLFTDVCLAPQDKQFCDLHYTLAFCDWDPSQEKTAETLDCFVAAGDALNDDIVDCIAENVDFEPDNNISYRGASGLAGYRIEYNILTGDGDLYFSTGAKWGGQEFTSTFIELYPFSVGTISIDGVDVAPPNGRILTSEALNHEFWRSFANGKLLKISDTESISLPYMRQLFSEHWIAMESCLVEAPNIFE